MASEAPLWLNNTTLSLLLPPANNVTETLCLSSQLWSSTVSLSLSFDLLSLRGTSPPYLCLCVFYGPHHGSVFPLCQRLRPPPLLLHHQVRGADVSLQGPAVCCLTFTPCSLPCVGATTGTPADALTHMRAHTNTHTRMRAHQHAHSHTWILACT